MTAVVGEEEKAEEEGRAINDNKCIAGNKSCKIVRNFGISLSDGGKVSWHHPLPNYESHL